MGCNFILDNNDRCDAKYELKYIMFRDPINHVTKEIELCPRHFGDLIQVPLLQPIKVLQFKRDNLVARNARESKIAKQNDVPFNWAERKGEVSTVTELIKQHYSYKCANVLCGRMISTLNPVYCMIVFSGFGKIINKFYFCSKDCNDKMKIRTGALIPVIRKEIPMQEFF